MANLLHGLRDSQSSVAENTQPTQETAKPDFFISYYYKAQREEAEEIQRIVKSLDRTCCLFGDKNETLNPRMEILRAAHNSERILCLLSPGYWNSDFCIDELESFWTRPDRRRNHRVIFFDVAPNQIDPSFPGLPPIVLTGLAPKEYEEKVKWAIQRATTAEGAPWLAGSVPATATRENSNEVPEAQDEPREYLEKVQPQEQVDEPRKTQPRAESESHRRSRLTPSLAFALLLLACLVLAFPVYFQFGPLGVWDAREAAAHLAGKDISLPWAWIWRSPDLREYVAAYDDGALSKWKMAPGQGWTHGGQFLNVTGAALLLSTLSQVDQFESAIAQFRAVFAGRTVRLLVDSDASGQRYRAFRLESDGQGSLIPAFVERKGANAQEDVLEQYRPISIRPTQTLHDLGISKEGEFFTFYLNRDVAVTFQPGKGTRLNVLGKAFGFAGDASGGVRLFRWSLVGLGAESQALVAHLNTPVAMHPERDSRGLERPGTPKALVAGVGLFGVPHVRISHHDGRVR